MVLAFGHSLAFVPGAVVLQATDLVLNQLPLVLVVAGLGLMGLEALAPGAHFVVLGVALLVAGLVGVALGALGLGGVILAVVLAGVVIASGAGTLYAYRQFDFYGGKNMAQTSDSNALRGKSGHVTEHVTQSDGQVKLDGGGFNPYYAARALDDEIPEGEPVMVTDPGGGNVVTVEALGAIEGDIERELAQEREEETDDERERETA